MKSIKLSNKAQSGFTIIELIVVILVVGIIAGISVVSYLGISQNAIASSLKTDLTNASDQLKLYKLDNGEYPTDNNCSSSTPPNICLKSSPGNVLTYISPSPYTSFTLTATNASSALAYEITNATPPVSIAYVPPSSTCATGFIPVPGSGTYGTNDFCVMKYEAKRVGSTTTPISEAGGTPWTGISQQTAMNNSPNVSGCTGCHLITEAEWLTIAQNVLGVASNWSTGIVGSGTVYRGHSDNQPTGSLEASTNDADGYYGETNTGGNQRRTLTLSNGEVIWDLAGNVYDWTSGTVTTGQPGITGESAYAWKEWTAPGFNNGTLSPDPSPTATGISDASGWNSGNAIGKLWSNSNDTTLRGFIRGGHWSAGANAGVLALYLNFTPDSTGGNVGFRVTSPPI